MSQVTNGRIDGGEGSFECWPGSESCNGSLDIAQLGCYGLVLTCHGRERVQGGAGEGDEDRLAVRKARELVVVENRELGRSEVKPCTGLPNKVAYVELGLREVRGG